VGSFGVITVHGLLQQIDKYRIYKYNISRRTRIQKT